MKKYILLLTASMVLVISGCATFQSPKVLEKGEQSLTVGASVVLLPLFSNGSESTPPLWIDINMAFRTYIAKSLDGGLQLAYSTSTFSAIADVKYQILTDPFYLAAGVGAGLLAPEFSNPFVAQALLIGGTDTFYIGIKPITNFTAELPIGGSILAGITIGKKPQFVIEGNFDYFQIDNNGLAALLGVGVRFVF